MKLIREREPFKPGEELFEHDHDKDMSGNNQDMSELDTSGENLERSGDEHSENNDDGQKGTTILTPPPFDVLVPQATDLPNQSLVEDVPNLVMNHLENNFHPATLEVSLNPHMNLNFLTRLNIP
jgi:hypothetical protein